MSIFRKAFYNLIVLPVQTPQKQILLKPSAVLRREYLKKQGKVHVTWIQNTKYWPDIWFSWFSILVFSSSRSDMERRTYHSTQQFNFTAPKSSQNIVFISIASRYINYMYLGKTKPVLSSFVFHKLKKTFVILALPFLCGRITFLSFPRMI